MSSGTSLRFAEAETGIVLDESGAWGKPEALFCPRFDSRADAEAFMVRYLENHPHAECWICSEGEPSGSLVVSPKFEEYHREKTAWIRWRMSSWIHRLPTAEPAGRLYQPQKSEQAATPNARGVDEPPASLN
jgi:hypothetical protein